MYLIVSLISCQFVYRTGLLCPMVCFIPCGDSFFFLFFWLQLVFGFSWDLLRPILFRCFPWRLFIYFFFFLHLELMCHPRDFVPLESFSLWGILRPHGICCASVVAQNTNSNFRILRVHESPVYPFTFGRYGGFVAPPEHFTERIDNIRTGPHAHVWPYTVTISSKGHVSHRLCGLQ